MNKYSKYAVLALGSLLSATAVHAATVVLGTSVINGTSQSIAISGFSDPVVITGVPTKNDDDPGAVSISNVTATNFNMSFKEWPYLDGNHANEGVSYMVLEKGRHTMADGSIWEVGTFTQGQGTREIKFSQPFAGTPVVLLSTQSQTEADTISVRAFSVTRHAFSAKLFEQELNDGHGVETIGYAAIYQPSSNGVTDEGHIYKASTEFLDNPGFQAANSFIVRQEEQSLDAETNHTFESIGLLEISGHTFASDNSVYGGDPITFRLTGSAQAHESCADVQLYDPSAQDGIYPIDSTGSGPKDTYCNFSIEGGGWALVSTVVYPKIISTPSVATDSVTDLTESKYLNNTLWANKVANSTEILFYSPSKNAWGVADIAVLQNPTFCTPLTTDLSANIIFLSEASGCDMTGGDYTAVGHSHGFYYRGNLYDENDLISIWKVQHNWLPYGDELYLNSDDLHIYIR